MSTYNPENPLIIPASGLKQFIDDLAKQYGVTYVRTPSDELAEVITRLSDDEIVQDGTKDLILALWRAGVINGSDRVRLLGCYLKEARHV